jgi:putative nucleotidyltransferase with HDIG domain
METKDNKKSFFSVSFFFIVVGERLPYDLYVNSSANEKKDRFVRIFAKNRHFHDTDLADFKSKYSQLYISEKQRAEYLQSLVRNKNVTDTQKTEIIRDSAIGYLDTLFDERKVFNTDLLEESLEGCRDSVESMVEVLQDYKVTDVQSLIGELSFHDFYTYDHSINVSMYCISLFKEIKPRASKEDLILAGLGGLLHDIGKTKISTEIINNPGKLTDEQFDVIKEHPGFGKELLNDSKCMHNHEGIDFKVIERIVYEHHENFNGTGYPNGISGEDIHLMARITAVVDYFDAVTTKRSYHEVLSSGEAIGVMAKAAGKKLDPEIFQALAKSVEKFCHRKESQVELPDNFDPCQPQNVLPFQNIETDFQKRDIFSQYKQEQEVENKDRKSKTKEQSENIKKSKKKKVA